jgi:3'-5' exoribonuclease
MLVRRLTEGQEVDGVLLVRELRGEALVLGDRSGTVTAVLGGAVAPCERGGAVRVQGTRRDRPAPRAADRGPRDPPARPEEVDEAALLDGPPRAATQMEADLRDLLATIQNPHLRALLDAVLGRTPRPGPVPRRAGGQALPPGLPARAPGALADRGAVRVGDLGDVPGIDRDVAVCGALLHDIGKLEAYTADPLAIDMTDSGKLQGEIPLGYYRVRRLIEDLPGFPRDLATAVLHIILSHHGALEHGSPSSRARARRRSCT